MAERRKSFEDLGIGTGRVFVIAELSANHLHDRTLAERAIEAAAAAGADAVKVQTYTPDTITIDSDQDYFKITQGTLWDGRTLYDLYQEAYMPWDWQPGLKEKAERHGLVFFSTPFDPSAVDFLEAELSVPLYKIASFEITDLPLISYVASKGKPVILSTGIAELGDIEAAVAACRAAGCEDIALLKCTSSYPAPMSTMNLATISDMRERFDTLVGLSDHSEGAVAAITAVAVGASIIEKHFTLDRGMGGPDAAFSMEPSEFESMVRDIRNAESALGVVTYALSDGALASRQHARSLFVVEDVAAGEVLTSENVRSIRPGHGLHPGAQEDVLGRRAAVDIARGTPLDWDLIT